MVSYRLTTKVSNIIKDMYYWLNSNNYV
jgi:hypothetical protein